MTVEPLEHPNGWENPDRNVQESKVVKRREGHRLGRAVGLYDLKTVSVSGKALNRHHTSRT